MPKRALIDHRPWLFASVIAALAYYFVKDGPLADVWVAAIKGMCVAFLALYAVRRGPGPDAQILAAVMLFSALGDVGIEFDFALGGGLFFFFGASLSSSSSSSLNSSNSSSRCKAAAATASSSQYLMVSDKDDTWR